MAITFRSKDINHLRELREALLASNPAEDGKMTMGELNTKFSGQVTLRAERAAVLAQLDEAIAKLEVNGAEKRL